MKTHTAEIHQLIHGYTDGHGQLGGSVKLSRVDARTALVLSDSSVSGAKVPPSGYLTGYPLVESGYYALARTWMATELPRPGCVWTHTLLIDFSDLATLSNLSNLLELFRRPTESSFHSYQVSLLYADMNTSCQLNENELKRAGDWLRFIYGYPEMSVTATREEELHVDKMAMAIWEQQWPKLRRSFRFCTLTVADRSKDNVRFDLQLLPEAAAFVRSRFRASVEVSAQTDERSSWNEEAVLDLQYADIHGLRSFLRKSGSEIGLGRSSFAALCLIHSAATKARAQVSEANAAVGMLLRELPSFDLQALAVVVVNLAIRHVHVLDAGNGRWLLSNLDLLDEDTFITSIPSLADLAVKAWLDPKFATALTRDGVNQLSKRERRVVDAIETDRLITKVWKVPRAVLSRLIMLRPNLLVHRTLWEGTDEEQEFLWRMAKDTIDPHELIEVLIALPNKELAAKATAYFGVTRSLSALSASCSKGSSSSEQRRHWLVEALRTVSAVAQAFTDGAEWARQLLVEISRLVAPEAIPNEVGADPWLGAYERSSGRVAETDQLFISSYLLNRALSGASRNAHQLVCKTLQLVYEKAADNVLTEEAWRVLEYRLPWSYFWYDWDRCKRLRDAVADLYMKQGIPAGALFEITDDLLIFQHLAKGIREKRKGRRYLEQTLVESPQSKAKLLSQKVALVRELV